MRRHICVDRINAYKVETVRDVNLWFSKRITRNHSNNSFTSLGTRIEYPKTIFEVQKKKFFG